MPLKTALLLIILNLTVSFCRAQETLMLLRSDSIFQLNYRSDGILEFVPRYSAPYLSTVGALSYCAIDSFYYGIRYDNAHFVRFKENGRFEDLGPAMNADSIPLPNEDLTTAVIEGQFMYVLSYSSNSIYKVDLSSKALKYTVLIKNIGFSLPNTLAWHPKLGRLYILDQHGSPLIINPQNGAIEKDIKQGAFANFPRKKLISYGKLWFGKDGRCFLLAGQEGVLYELDTENKIAYFVSNIGFNSPKDAIANSTVISPPFIQQELVTMHIQRYPHFRDYLELEWYERNEHAPIAYYYTEKLNSSKQKWEEIAFMPGYPSNTQSNRYTTLDRMPLSGENCYRLRIEYHGGYTRYSSVVCYDNSSNKSEQKLRLANPIVDYQREETMLHLIGFYGRKLSLELYHSGNGKKLWSKTVVPFSSDQSEIISLGENGGWYELRIIDGKKLHRLKIFKLG